MKSILFVDDEPNILDGIRRLLRHKRDEWDMVFASSGQEALKIMEKRHFDIVVSDMRMPGMLGTQLLETVMVRSPETIRFILSGHADQDLVYKSLGATHQYMSKPCETEVLVNMIERAFGVRNILRKESLKKLVTGIGVIPSLPELYLQVVEAIAAPNASTHRVGQIIAKDIGMSAKVLQLVNSAFFGMPRRVTDPTQAAALLGLDILKSLVLMVHVFSQMDRVALPGWTMEHLWGHSMRVARCAQAIAQHTQADKGALDDAFMAGLFHDLGKLVLIANKPEQYAQVLELGGHDSAKLLDAERQVFTGTHEEVGAYLLGLWGFPDPIVEAVAFHHRPSDCLGLNFSPLTAVHVANVFANELVPVHPDAPKASVDLTYLEQMGQAESLPAWETICRGIIEQGVNADGINTVR